MGIVTTIPEKCKRCYTCVRECPAKAIKVEGGQAMVIDERCIACGNCVKVCAQKAKRIQDDVPAVNEMLAGSRPVFACMAPSFPAAFDTWEPGEIISALRKLGFHEVWEVAFGAELVSPEYARLFKKAQQTGGRLITTPCPAIVGYIEKHMPALHDALAPIASPMIAVARAIRRRHGEDVRIVFIGPCIAKKDEIRDPCVAGTVDSVLTFKELMNMIEAAGVAPGDLTASGFDGPRSYQGRSFPLSGGLLKTAGLSTDILENDIVITEGKDRVLVALKELAENRSQARFFDVLFCEGCINGPKMLNDLSVFARKEILADFVNEQSRYMTQKELAESLAEFKSLDLSRGFTQHRLHLAQPTADEIAHALRAMKKFRQEDQLNCGACGYKSCHDKAIAVCQGLAEPEMCLPYLVEELEAAFRRLQLSHKKLASTQQRLVQTERLASMGQLSAGVAHEINNPLGTILIYSHMLLKQLKGSTEVRPDLEMIVNEATRCKNIVRGLLDFARQSRVSKAPTDIAALIRDVIVIMQTKATTKNARLITELQDALPSMMIDGVQIKQMLVNLVENAVDAVGDNGEVTVRAQCREDGQAVEITVEDNGCGIAEENLAKLFTPFFTTKEMGKGTGLGLAIAYGVVKMHSGDISVESEAGKGTTFSVWLPVGREQEEPEELVGEEAAEPEETGDLTPADGAQ